jgi:hypothetical protein
MFALLHLAAVEPVMLGVLVVLVVVDCRAGVPSAESVTRCARSEVAPHPAKTATASAIAPR